MNVRATSVKMEEHAGDLLRTMCACVHSTTLVLPVQNVRMVVLLHTSWSLINYITPVNLPLVLPLEIQCSSTLLGGVLTVDCSANKPLAMTTCLLDGNPYVPCTSSCNLKTFKNDVVRYDVLLQVPFLLTFIWLNWG